MDEVKLSCLSKLLSQILRHHPYMAGITLDRSGWASVSELLLGCERAGIKIELSELYEVVTGDSKQRFQFNEDSSRIRACQGHTVKVDLGYPVIRPPILLYHGTTEQALPCIRREGLKKMSRHHVHLSATPGEAEQIGARHGIPVILVVESEQMYQRGFEFFQATNGVWLVDSVPETFIDFPKVEGMDQCTF